MYKELKINLQDTEWKYDYIDHDRNIARAIVYDENGYFYFVRAKRDDDFGKATLIETAGGGVEEGEDLIAAIKRELKEETGLDIVEIIPGLGRDKVYLSPGMTDESVNLVYCTCDGELSKDGLEEDEDLEPLLISKEEAKAILQSDSKIDIKCLMVLQSFININIDI